MASTKTQSTTQSDDESTDDDDDVVGLKNAYSVEDLLNELGSDNDTKIRVTGKVAHSADDVKFPDETAVEAQAKLSNTALDSDVELAAVSASNGCKTETEHGADSDVLIGDTYSCAYDEVLTENIYAEPCDSVAEANTTGSDGEHEIYENIDSAGAPCAMFDNQHDDDDGWDSSEFEDYDDDMFGDQNSVGAQSQHSQGSEDNVNSGDIAEVKPEAKQSGFAKAMELRRPVMNRVSWRKSGSADSQSTSSKSPANMFDKLRMSYQKFGKSQNQTKTEPQDDTEYLDSQLQMIEVTLNTTKHPPAELPPVPAGLSRIEEKRRHVIQSIVTSENSYVSSLRRIVEDYEKPLLDPKVRRISQRAVQVIFHKIRDILQCHNMFGIELAEAVKLWDTEQKIGNVFTAMFQKSIIFEAYSSYVNNFSVAMETVKKQARSRPLFGEFLKQKLESSTDRMSLFGLMVKPVQRFPQFIMLLQDLLKLTPKDHPDRLALQIALTELDTLTHRLNETKRDSENQLEVKRLLGRVSGIWHNVKIEDGRTCMIRQDDFIEVRQKNNETRTKGRRLLLLNDQLICTSVLAKEPDCPDPDRLAFVWSIPVKDIEVVDMMLPSTFKPVKTGFDSDKSSAVKPKQGKSSAAAVATSSELNPYRKELDDMLHDLNVLEQITELSCKLRLRYESFSQETLNGFSSSLQLMIRQKCDVDRCLLTLAVPNKNNSKVKHTFQAATPVLKHEWLLDLLKAKLALEPFNHPAWSLPESESSSLKVPLFIQSLQLEYTKDVSKKAKSRKKSTDLAPGAVCMATRVTLPSTDLPNGFGVEHLWVCESSGSANCRVFVVSLHTNMPSVIESFELNETGTVAGIECVPGCSVTSPDKMAFVEDTVWTAIDDKIVICKVTSEDRNSKHVVLKLDHKSSCLRYLDGHVYVGLKNGSLYIYSRDQDGAWKVKNREKVTLGSNAVTCLMPVGGNSMWAACESDIHVINVTTTAANKLTVTKTTHRPSNDSSSDGHIGYMAKAGAGLMVSLKNRGVVQLYHLETFQHLTDISVASAISRMLEDQDVASSVQDAIRSIHITCMLAESGLLWIGTSAGFILTVPLPRLEGVPQIKGRPTVSYHGHASSVQFLSAVHCSTVPCSWQRNVLESGKAKPSGGPLPSANGKSPTETAGGIASSKHWSSTPDLLAASDESNVCNLYESLLQGTNTVDLDSELIRATATADNVVFRKNIHQRHHTTTGGGKRGATFQHANHIINRLSYVVTKSHHRNVNMVGRQLKAPAAVAAATQKTPAAVSNESDPVACDNQAYDEGLDDETNVNLLNPSESCEAIDTPPTPETPIVAVQPNSAVMSYRQLVVPLCASRVVSNLVHVSTNKSLIVVSSGESFVSWSNQQQQQQQQQKPDKSSVSVDNMCLLMWKC